MDAGLIERRSFQRMVDATRRIERTPRNRVNRDRFPAKGVAHIVIAEITGAGLTDGFYKAKEKVLQGSLFVDLQNGREWDSAGSGTLPDLVNLNLLTTIQTGEIVFPNLIGDISGGFDWAFHAQAPAILKHPFRLKIDPEDDTNLIVGADRDVFDPLTHDKIAVGRNSTTKDAPEDIIISTNSIIFYEIQQRQLSTISQIITVALKIAAIGSEPEYQPFLGVGINDFEQNLDVSNRYNVVLGTVKFSGGVITAINQRQFKDIELEDRRRSIIYLENSKTITTIGQQITQGGGGGDGGLVGFIGPDPVIPINTDQKVHIRYRFVNPANQDWGLTIAPTSADVNALLCQLRIDTDGRLEYLVDYASNILSIDPGQILPTYSGTTGINERDLDGTPDLTNVHDVLGTFIKDINDRKIG